MNADEIIKKLKSAGSPKDLASMTRFGINSKNACGVTIPFLRSMAKNIGKNHSLALELWKYGIHEARVLAGERKEGGVRETGWVCFDGLFGCP